MSNESKSKIFRAGPDGQTTVETDPSDAQPTSARPIDAMSFSTHILSLNMTALMHLGAVPGVSDEDQDPEAARHIVDTLAMLAEKTVGNLNEEERKLLNTLVYELKLKIVQSSP